MYTGVAMQGNILFTQLVNRVSTDAFTVDRII